MASSAIKLPGTVINKTLQEFLPLAQEPLAEAEEIMEQLRESQRRADELARRTIIRTGTMSAMAIELAQAEPEK